MLTVSAHATTTTSKMKTSQTIAISAITSSAFVIGMNHAPQTTYSVFAGTALTIIFALVITASSQLIRNMNS